MPLARFPSRFGVDTGRESGAFKRSGVASAVLQVASLALSIHRLRATPGEALTSPSAARS